MYINITSIVVRYQETDQMGVAHHSVYPVWYEVGRTAFIREFGVPYGQLEADGLFLPLIELRSKFRSYARYEDCLTVHTRVAEVTPVRLNFAYEVCREGEKSPVATGMTYHAFANRELRAVNMKKYRPDLYEIFARLCDR